jgi:UPF0755 protein
MRRFLLIVLVLCIAAGLWGAQAALRWWDTPLQVGDQPVQFLMAPGESLGDVSGRLARRGVLRWPWLLNAVARLRGADASLHSGEYAIAAGTTPGELLALLQRGATVRYTVTLPEGITLGQAIAILHRAPALEARLQGPADPRLLALVSPAENAEGLFLPETYQYQRGDSDLDILRQAHTLLSERLAALWEQRDPSLPYDSPLDAVIMASIVERETGVPEERERIAGVFLRRLDRRMRLQTDPTVIYGLGDAFDGNLTRSHLRDSDNPYNTYRHHGLPPGPIALPGAAALYAVFHPANEDALYFVARGDGSHVFSATLADHERAVADYQLRRRADYRSSPAGRGNE